MGLKHDRFVIPVLAAVLLQACGGGGDPAAVSAPPPPPEVADSMTLPFVTAAGELKLFDPAMPGAAAVTVDTGLDPPDRRFGKAIPILVGTYDPAANSLADAHLRYLVYVREGAVRRVDLLRTESHAVATVSSVTDACRISSSAYDYQDPLDSGLLVETAGADESCLSTADNESRYIRLGSSPTDAGVPAPGNALILESMLAGDGSLQYLVVLDLDAANIRRHDADFGNPVDAFTLAPELFVLGGPDVSRTTQYFVLKLVDEPSARIIRYDVAANTAESVHQYADTGSVTGRGGADATHLYFVEGGIVRRVAHDSTTPQVLHTAASGTVAFEELALTRNRIVLRSTDSGSATPNAIGSLARTGGNVLTTLQAATAEPVRLYGTAGQRAYWMVGSAWAGTLEAVHAGEDGSGVVRYANGAWSGSVSQTSFNIGAIDNHALPRVFLLGQADDTGLVTVRAVTAATGAASGVLGLVSDAVRGEASGYGRYVLANVEIARSGTGNDFDVYFVDTASEGSLQSLAETVGLDDAAP